MALNSAVVRATLTAVEKFLENKQFEAAGREIGQLVAAGAHEGEEGHRILALYNRLQEATTMPLYGPYSLNPDISKMFEN